MLLTSDHPHPKRKARLWLWVCLCLPFLLLFGVFCLSLFRPLRLSFGNYHLVCRMDSVPDYPFGSSFSLKDGLLLFRAGDWLYSAKGWSTPYSVARVQKLVLNEVPLGSSPSEVKQWLKWKRIEHWHFNELTIDSRVEDRGHKPDELGGMTTGRIPETNYDFMMVADIELLFVYDQDKKLLDRWVEEDWTGP
jgi:hypothetical protein